MTNEIRICDIATLSNKKLTTQVNKIYTALKGMEKNKWQFAESVANIMNNELYVDDFETDKAFAEFLGVSPSYVSRVTKCAAYHHIECVSTWTISKVQELIGVHHDEVPNLVATHNLSEDSTVKEIREAVRLYCDGCGESTEEDDEPLEDSDEVIDVNVVEDSDEPTDSTTVALHNHIIEVVRNADDDMILRIYDILRENGVI